MSHWYAKDVVAIAHDFDYWVNDELIYDGKQKWLIQTVMTNQRDYQHFGPEQGSMICLVKRLTNPNPTTGGWLKRLEEETLIFIQHIGRNHDPPFILL